MANSDIDGEEVADNEARNPSHHDQADTGTEEGDVKRHGLPPSFHSGVDRLAHPFLIEEVMVQPFLGSFPPCVPCASGNFGPIEVFCRGGVIAAAFEVAQKHDFQPIEAQDEEPQEDDGGEHGSQVPGDPAQPGENLGKDLVYGEEVLHVMKRKGGLLALPFCLCR